jgi:hypothetical protein
MGLHQGLLDESLCGSTTYRGSALVCVSRWLEGVVLARHPEDVLVLSIPCGVQIPGERARRPGGCCNANVRFWHFATGVIGSNLRLFLRQSDQEALP